MEYTSILQRDITPFKQLAIFLFFMVIVEMIFAFPYRNNLTEPSLFAWEVSFTVLLLFAVSNSILSLASKDHNRYWLTSLISYVVLAFFGGLLADFISGVSMDEAGHFRWLYLVFTFGYLVLLTIVSSMRKIIEIAQRQDDRLRGES